MQNTATDWHPSGLYAPVLNSKDEKESQISYSNWAEKFDDDQQHMGHNMHLKVAKCVVEHIKHTKDTTLLDVGAGTGLVGFCLRKKENFQGQIDILDANMEMLYEASKKDLKFRNIIRHWANGKFPLAPHSYDVITCVGSLLPLHLPATSLKHMAKLLKPGGLMIFNTRRSVAVDYVESISKVMEELKNDDDMEIVEMKEIPYHLDANSAVCELYVCRVGNCIN